MPEIKHSFTTGKMNKDLDERLVRNGEYRHAENIQVHTTDQQGDGGAAGIIQNIKGTAEIGRSYYAAWHAGSAPTTESEYAAYGNSLYPRCVAGVADEKNDKAYFFFASPMTTPIGSADFNPNANNERKYVDFIIEEDQNNTTLPVVVDYFAYVNTLEASLIGNAQDGSSLIETYFTNTPWNQALFSSASGFRPGMTIKFLSQNGTSILPAPLTVKAVDGTSVLFHEEYSFDIAMAANSGGYSLDSIWIVAEAPRVLNFTPTVDSVVNQMVAPLPYAITGVNIIDNLIFWTDSYSEPKKINIDRCKAGTDASTFLTSPSHTKLFVKNKEGDLVDAATISHTLDQGEISDVTGLQLYGSGVDSYLKEEHVTVMRKAPTAPPSLLMNQDSRVEDCTIDVDYQFVDNMTSTAIFNGEFYDINNAAIPFTKFRFNDILIISRNDGAQVNPLQFKAKFVGYVTDAGLTQDSESSVIRIQILVPATMEPDDVSWQITIERPDPIFELKLVRFGYRYKYEDGEYSAFSPWSEVAFLPQKFEYTPSTAYNIGMVNDCRDLVVKDFIPATIPLDVKEVDVLYKATDNANCYVVDTVKKNISSEWELFTPDGGEETTEILTGYLNIKSEMIHKVLPSNQILRAWDNVPRYALAQEITGNRLLYGNYTQGYDIKESVGLTSLVQSESVNVSSDLPKKSIKSIRNYKIGMVFGDKYGRETPVITPSYSFIDNSDEGFGSTTGDIFIPKTLCDKSNSFIVSQNWGDPNSNITPPITSIGGWVDYVKYYIKETSNEYYNLIMDRWYDSGDHGTIWISFNSADRNKVDEDTYLILKNRHGSNDAVIEKARYKIIAIEGNAPDYIKTTFNDLGRLKDVTGVETYDSVWSSSSADVTAVSPIHLYANPDEPDQHNKIEISKSYWFQSSVGGSDQDSTDSEVFGSVPEGQIKMRIIGRNANLPSVELKSSWRIVTHWNYGSDGGTDDDIVTLTLNSPFIEGDVDMKSRFEGMYAGGANPEFDPANLQYDFEFREEVVKNKPEFDGKFFVKIQKDSMADSHLLNQVGMSGPGFNFDGAFKLHYISSAYQNKHKMDSPPGTLTEYANFTSWFGGAFADFGGKLNSSAMEMGNEILFDHASFYMNDTSSGNEMADSTGAYAVSEGTNGAVPYFAVGGYYSNNNGTAIDYSIDATQYITYGLPTLLTYWTEDEDENDIWIAGSAFNGAYTNLADGAQTTNIYPVPYTIQGYDSTGEIRGSFSPFGSCSENYNDMTRNFWQNTYSTYTDSLKTMGEGTVDPSSPIGVGNSTGVVFLDEVNMARMKIRNGPQAGTEIDVNPEESTTGPHGIVEGGFGPFDKYWRPIDAFHQGEAKINGLTPEMNAEFGVGSMCISYCGGNKEEFAPALWAMLRQPGRYFTFDNDPTGSVYKTVGVLRSSSSFGAGSNMYQYNWRGNSGATNQSNIPPVLDFGGSEGFQYTPLISTEDAGGTIVSEDYFQSNAIQGNGEVDGMEINNCDIYPNLDSNNWLLRHTSWIEFRKVDSANPLQVFNQGMNLGQFDPRAFMKHDGSESIGIRLLSLSYSKITTELGEETEIELGACFETEPKEDIGLDIYYEASTAIPMTLTKENVFNFAPINSRISISRTVNGKTKQIDLALSKKDHRVSNIHFSGIDNSQAIIAIQSKGVTSETYKLHKIDFLIGDTIEFTHPDGTMTSAIIKNYWQPTDFPSVNLNTDSNGQLLGDNGFYALDDDDAQYGVSSGPKAFTIINGEFLNVQFFAQNGVITAAPFSASVTMGSQVQSIIVEGESGPISYVLNEPIYISAFDAESGTTVFSNGTTQLSPQYLSQYGIDLNSTQQITFVVTFLTPTGYYGIDIEVWDRPVKLPFNNCYAFGNGVESDRIRDDFNAPQLDNGVKASTTFSDYGEENVSSGMIYSGIYNSTSQVNDLNEFNQAEKITKNLNPSYGAIQALKTRDTDVVVFTEDKVLKVLSNKDALFNADGNPQLTATNRVLGTAVPFAGDYGISNNPESLAVDQYRMYFTDRQRGAVLRLSQDGLTPISATGMASWFRHRLKYTSNLVGSFDDVTKEYNLTMLYPNSNNFNNETISFSENIKGWVSFKSFVLSQGLSIAGRYLSTNKHRIYQHHADEDTVGQPVNRNTFHDEGIKPSVVHVLFNDMPSSVKSFKTFNYEGSIANKNKRTPDTLGIAIDAFSGSIFFDLDGNPLEPGTQPVSTADGKDYLYDYKSMFNISGWQAESVTTDLQEATLHDFKEKEGKWFAQIKGLKTETFNLDVHEFSVQGIGMADNVLYTGVVPDDGSGDGDGDGDGDGGDGGDDSVGCPDGYTLISTGECVEFAIFGCMDVEAANFDATANVSCCCVYNVPGCMDGFDPNYNSEANIPDTTQCTGYTNGCMDNGNQPWSPFPGTAALNYNPLATQAGYMTVIDGSQFGLPDDQIFTQVIWPGGVYDSSQFIPYEGGDQLGGGCPGNYNGCCTYGNIIIDDPDNEGWIEDDVDGGGGTDPDGCQAGAQEQCEANDGVWIHDPENGIECACFGCTTVGNDNYNPYATNDCGDIEYGSSTECDDDGGLCLCCKDETTNTGIGCTDMTACNYDEDATLGCVNNECCNYDCYCCGDESATNYNNLAGTFEALSSPHPNCQYFSNDQPFPCVDGWGPIIVGCMDDGGITAVQEDGSMGTYPNPQTPGTPALNYTPGATQECAEGTCDDLYDNGWCDCCQYENITDAPDDTAADDDDDDNINEVESCFRQDGTVDPFCGCTDPTMFNYCSSCTTSCPDDSCCEPFIYGCTTPGTFNYNPDANTDDGSCVDIIPGCMDDGFQDWSPYPGFAANNYNPEANTNGAAYGIGCTYDTPGCTDPTMWNYNPEASGDDGSCEPIVCGCMDATATNYDPLANSEYLYLTQIQVSAGVGNIQDPTVDVSQCDPCVYPTSKVVLDVDQLDSFNEDDSYPEVGEDNVWPGN